MRSWYISVAVIALLLLGIFLAGDSLAKMAWDNEYPGLALVLNRSDSELAMQLGNYYFNGGAYDLDKAEKAYLRAISIDSKIIGANYQLARIYFVKGEDDKAIEYINKEIEINPQSLRSLYVRGLIHGSSGRLAKAEEDFKRFVEWSPTEWAGYNDLAWVLAKERKYKEAEEVLKIALEKVDRAKDNPWLWNSLGVSQLNQNDNLKAKKSFEKARETSKILTLKEWQKAYPGNDPAESEKAFEDFKIAIEKNIEASLPVR